MPGYTIVNLKDVEDQAPKFGLSPNQLPPASPRAGPAEVATAYPLAVS